MRETIENSVWNLVFAAILTTIITALPAVQAQHIDVIDIAYPRLEILRSTKEPAALVVRTWDGGGTTNNWSEAANWSDNTVPNSGDNVVFDATSVKNATIDTNVETANITIAAGYTGAISMAAGVDATFHNTSTVSGGTFNAGSGMLQFGSPGVGGGLTLSGGEVFAGSGRVNILSVFEQTGGIFNAGNANVTIGHPRFNGGTFNALASTISIWGDLNFGSGAFNAGTGRVVLYSTNRSLTMTGSQVTFNNLTINKDEGHRIVISDINRTVRVTGTLALTEGGINRGSGSVLKAEGPVSIAAAFGDADNGNPNNAVGGNALLLIKDGPAGRAIDWPASAALPHVHLDDANVTLTVTGTGLARSGAITLTKGTIEVPTASLKIGHGASTINSIDQSNGLFHIGTGDFNLLTGTFRLAGGTFDMDSGNAIFPCFLNVNILGGTFNASSGTTTMCTNDETIDGIGGELNLQNTGVFNGGNGTFNINKNVIISGGTFNASTGTTYFGFAFTHSSGTFNHNNGTVIFDSIHPAYAMNNPGTETFYDLTVDLRNPTGSVTLGNDNWIVNGTLRLMNGNVSSGTFQAKGNVIVENTADAGTALINFNGDGPQTFTNNGGLNTTGQWTVNKTSGTLTAATPMILGTAQALTVTSGILYLENGSNLTSGALTIGANGTLANDSATTITLGANAVNNGRLNLEGGGPVCAQPDSILLRSTVAGTRRNWSGTGIFRIVDVDVRDMGGATASTPAITVFNGTDAGNNGSNWTFNNGCPPDLATQVGFVVQPSNGTAGQSISPSIQVAVQDSSGNTLPGATNAITLAIANNPSNGMLSGTVTRNAINGIATFDNISINRSGPGYTLQATSTTLTAATSNGFDIAAGAATKLGFITQPTDTVALQIMSPAVRVAVQDAFGNTVSTEVRSISVGGGVGIRSAETVSGVATFDDLSSDDPGSDYVMFASTSGLTDGSSEPFDIIRPILLVTNVNDSGAGSLRAAISTSEQIVGHDQVHFNLPGPAPFSIAPISSLPSLVNVTVDGTTQPGFTDTPIVELRGDSIANPASPDAGLLVGSDTTVKGLVINRFDWAVAIMSHDTTIKGNYFGTDVSGNVGLGGGTIYLDSNVQRSDIGGTQPADRNVLANGMRMFGPSPSSPGENVIRGNYIGTNAAGNVALNNHAGIYLLSSENTIGGTEPGAGNLISGNTVGIVLGANRNKVQGNLIGTNAAGNAPPANQNQLIGISISGNGNVIGGDGVGAPNTIAFNTHGVLVNLGNRNSIRRNSIRSNSALGIDLAHNGSGQTANDYADTDVGPNDVQNFPVLSWATSDGAQTRVTGTLFSTPVSMTLDFYSVSTCDPTGFGEGAVHLGTATGISASSGLSSFTRTLPPTQVGHFITATATDVAGNTSEFSRCQRVSPAILTISGRALDGGGNPLPDTLVRLSGARTATAVTNANGEYAFPDLPTESNYSVAVSKVNHDFTPPNRTYTNIVTNQTNQNYTAVKARFSISGQLTVTSVWGPVYPLSGVRLALSGPTTRFAIANGAYAFNELPPGKYSLTATKDSYTFTPQSTVVTITNFDQTANLSSTPITPLEGRLFYHWASLESMNADGSASASLGISGASNSFSISRDGRKLVYPKHIPSIGSNSLYMSNADGSDETELIAGSSTLNHWETEWSPDGSKVAYIQVSAGRSALRVKTLGGTSTTVSLPGLRNMYRPSWLSNTRLVFHASTLDDSRGRVFSVNISGTGLTQLSPTEAGVSCSSPVASPDGSKIAYIRFSGGLGGRLIVMNSDGTSPIQIADDVYSSKPAWSPDGSRVAFIRASDSKVIAVNSSTGAGARIIRDARTTLIAWGPKYTFPTTTGPNVNINAGGARVTFPSVGSFGITTFTPIGTAYLPAPPFQFAFSGMSAYEISTTAAHTTPATVCLKVPSWTATTQTAFDRLNLLHFEASGWINRTTTRNFSTRTVCSEVTTLGVFAMTVGPAASSGDEVGDLGAIRGVIVDETGDPLAGVTVELGGTEEQLTSTDEFGNFHFPNLTAGGDYIVRPTQFGYVFAEPAHTIFDLTGEATVAFVGTETNFSISGRVTNVDGSPAVGLELSLDGASSVSTTTDANGDYSFDDLPAQGSYIVTPFGTGFFSPRLVTLGSLTGNASGVDFVHYADAPEFVTVGGRVVDANGQGIAKARVTMTSPDGEVQVALTSPFGFYSFPAVRPGDTYTLELSKKGFTFAGNPFAVYVVGSEGSLNFTADP